MNFRKTEAITIGQRDYSDTSQILTFYTNDYGKLTALARGIKRPKHRLLNPPDIFSYSEIIFISKSPQGLNLLTEITVRDNFPLLRINLARLRMAFYVARFLDELTEPDEPNPPLFNLALRTLQQLASVRPVSARIKKARKITDNSCSDMEKMIIFAFEAQALKFLGYMPNTQSCPVCKKTLAKSRKVVFSFYNGSILCPACRGRQARKDDLIEVSAGVMKLVDVLSNPFLPDLERLKITGPMRAELRGFINKYITYIANT
ncbi:MAG: DNA repair protein RecO [Planctomycetes bacterium]|nr:DNA repair protein RecO [Planctomycetota bacterium]